MEKTFALRRNKSIFTLEFAYMTEVSFMCGVPLGQTTRKYFLSNRERFRNAYMFNFSVSDYVQFVRLVAYNTKK